MEEERRRTSHDKNAMLQARLGLYKTVGIGVDSRKECRIGKVGYVSDWTSTVVQER